MKVIYRIALEASYFVVVQGDIERAIYHWHIERWARVLVHSGDAVIADASIALRDALNAFHGSDRVIEPAALT